MYLFEAKTKKRSILNRLSIFLFLIWLANLTEETEITGMSNYALYHRNFLCFQRSY